MAERTAQACRDYRDYRDYHSRLAFVDTLLASPRLPRDHMTGAADIEATGLPDNQTTRTAPFGATHARRSNLCWD